MILRFRAAGSYRGHGVPFLAVGLLDLGGSTLGQTKGLPGSYRGHGVSFLAVELLDLGGVVGRLRLGLLRGQLCQVGPELVNLGSQASQTGLVVRLVLLQSLQALQLCHRLLDLRQMGTQ